MSNIMKRDDEIYYVFIYTLPINLWKIKQLP
ncbi:hypothetical protein T01_7340 [Trichinella spiralis]|uniref:Uncharacterized protein n=1 Tax=Trichinella spiralis TaxID=6334 RepID=A0A0V0Z980_TRISP|nr:hypothetical protein T01_7340 [Trichinella spiralis]